MQATAQGDTVSVFLLAQPAEMRKHNDFYWDEASLVVGGGGGPVSMGGGSEGSSSSGAATPSAPSGPTPTLTPMASSSSRSNLGIRCGPLPPRAGLTLDAFLALNPGLTSDSFIQAGEQYIIGQLPRAQHPEHQRPPSRRPKPLNLRPQPQPNNQPQSQPPNQRHCHRAGRSAVWLLPMRTRTGQ